ncbi:MAG: hopanoid biosynthesis-associated protein HpnK [Gammaproteobacteria bacterium]|nr:hopanoid biosynthesis-associated protein HpnK [Gammaproteobacteria bacterium]
MNRLIVTADDFGASVNVNEAVELAHRHGTLSAASLMVAATAATDAVRRARALPSLRVGLHLVVVDGRPMLPPARVPDIVDAAGFLPAPGVGTGVRFFFHGRARAQLRAEIRAQFEAFRATGLPLDHVNAHHHMHLHPTVLTLMLEIGREFGLKAVRVPYEPPLLASRAAGTHSIGRATIAFGLGPWIWLLRRRLRRAGVASNDQVLGLGDSGHIDAALLTRFIEMLPDGVTEIYCHPQAGDAATRDPAADAELRALMAPEVRAALSRLRLHPLGYGDLTERTPHATY